MEYKRKVDKKRIPTCNIMGVNIAAINMEWLVDYLEKNISEIKGDYICVSNVHTTVTSFEDADYCAIQNGGLMAIPDGGPLSTVGQKRGHKNMERTTGPSLMGEIFEISAKKGYRHYFYGSKEETLELLYQKLTSNYPGIQIAGMYSPPFRPLTEEEDRAIVERINETKAEMRRAIADGTVMKYLQKVPIHKDDLFFIQAGTVHAIGAGALVAEIQENSNLTYRLYDYDRVGKDGKKRELHIDKALDVANLKSSAEPKQPLRVLKYRQGIASELLTRCKYFEVYRMIVNTERRQKVHYRADEIAFRVLLCVNGCGTISYEGGNLPFYKGDCIFVPADSEVLTIHGQAQFLDVRG